MGDTIVYGCVKCGVTITAGYSTPKRACPVCGGEEDEVGDPPWRRKGSLG